MINNASEEIESKYNKKKNYKSIHLPIISKHSINKSHHFKGSSRNNHYGKNGLNKLLTSHDKNTLHKLSHKCSTINIRKKLEEKNNLLDDERIFKKCISLKIIKRESKFKVNNKDINMRRIYIKTNRKHNNYSIH